MTIVKYYVSPEGLWKEAILEISQKREISLVVVDEAHCISTWGHDFRPDYLQIKTFIEKLNKRPIITAFTATATKYVQDDIIKELSMKEDINIIKGEIERTNLYLRAFYSPNRWITLCDILNNKKDSSGKISSSGIIYCITRKDTEKYSAAINKEFGKLTSTFYHGGLTTAIRTQNQELFVEGFVKIIVATCAFGMGIDKIKHKLELLDKMVKYSQTSECLGNYILEYFGSPKDGTCGHCDKCEGRNDHRGSNLRTILIKKAKENIE